MVWWCRGCWLEGTKCYGIVNCWEGRKTVRFTSFANLAWFLDINICPIILLTKYLVSLLDIDSHGSLNFNVVNCVKFDNHCHSNSTYLHIYQEIIYLVVMRELVESATIIHYSTISFLYFPYLGSCIHKITEKAPFLNRGKPSMHLCTRASYYLHSGVGFRP